MPPMHLHLSSYPLRRSPLPYFLHYCFFLHSVLLYVSCWVSKCGAVSLAYCKGVALQDCSKRSSHTFLSTYVWISSLISFRAQELSESVQTMPHSAPRIQCSSLADLRAAMGTKEKFNKLFATDQHELFHDTNS